ncbi:MAG: hypothetical protein AB1634_10620 [Thermodesulfobacteriota bacterium]
MINRVEAARCHLLHPGHTGAWVLVFALGLGLALLAARPALATGVTDPTLVLPPQPMPLPAVGQPVVDPVFGSTLRRISNASQRRSFEVHTYSQLQAFSADNQYVLTSNTDGYLIRSVASLAPVAGLDTSSWNDPRWHPTRAHTIVHYDRNDDTVVLLQFTDVDTRVTETVYTFPAQYEHIRVNQSFDEISRDGGWLAGMLTRDDGQSVIFAFDLANLRLAAQVPVAELFAGPCAPDPEWGILEPDWIGVSPLGRYLMVQWERDGTARCSGLESWDLESGAFIGRPYDGHQHGDLGIDADGVSEFFMTFETSSTLDPNRPAIAVRALPGTATASPSQPLLAMDWSDDGHISCKGPAGRCLVTNGGWLDDGWTPLERELFLVGTDGAVERLVHHRSSSCGYWVQPRASISRDGRFVVFDSDWAAETRRVSCNDPATPDGAADPYILDRQGTSAPRLDLRANGNPGPLSVAAGQPVSLTLSVDPGSFAGTRVEWRLAVLGGRRPFVSPAATVPLQALTSATVLTTPLPAGTFVFAILADTAVDGRLGWTWYDYVVVESASR